MTQNKKFADFQVAFNQLKVAELFEKYEEIGFIYPAKKALLAPHFEQISENWKRLLASKEEFLWIFNNQGEARSKFASICAWKHSNYGLQAQHLVSSGNPFLSLKVMLAAQFKAEHHVGAEQVRSSQNWFRPNNRYAYRIFASMYEKLGPQKAALTLFQYLQLKLHHIRPYEDIDYQSAEVSGIDHELIDFVADRYGQVFVRAEELDQEDIQFRRLNTAFSQYGLNRSRKVLKIKDSRSGRVVAVVVANRAPLGMNFSFLENKAFYIVDEKLDRIERAKVIQIMNSEIKSYYEDLALGAIPIVTDIPSSTCLQRFDGVLMREYLQSIWMREGFPMWYEHINSFLQKIEGRLNRRR